MPSLRQSASRLTYDPTGYMPQTDAAYLTESTKVSVGPISVVPNILPERARGKVPYVVRANRLLRTTLIAMCGLAILGYGLDVAASNDVGRLEEQARRLNEQNTELSAQLLRVISFQGIQDSVLGRSGLRVPEQVMIIKEVQPYPLAQFEAGKYHLPLMAGY